MHFEHFFYLFFAIFGVIELYNMTKIIYFSNTPSLLFHNSHKAISIDNVNFSIRRLDIDR